jgi:2-methylisocitrate lyase-like PEP mutase family enzyme
VPIDRQKAERFRALHVRGQPLVLFNVWDAGSAKAVAASGALAIATGSWSVANANGYSDGENVPLDFAIENLRRIVRVTDLPVSIDLEAGYGNDPEGVGRTVGSAAQAGAVGCNLEDSVPASGALRDPTEQAARIREARRAADALGAGFFINARTDVFFVSGAETHSQPMVAEAVERIRRYAAAGADGIFAPGLTDIRLIASLASASPLPLNIMVTQGTPPLKTLAEHGVARVSHGAGPYLAAIRALEKDARSAGSWR